MSFVHLHTHSAYSLSEGAIKAEKLAALAAAEAKAEAEAKKAEGSGRKSMSVFVDVLMNHFEKHMPNVFQEERVAHFFGQLDKDGNGLLELEELRVGVREVSSSSST